MFSYLEALTPTDRERELQQIEKLLSEDPTALVPLYRDAAFQNVARETSNSMITSVSGTVLFAIIAGAFVGFPIALTAGCFILAQQFINSHKKQRLAYDSIEDGGSFLPHLDKRTQREYKQLAAAVGQHSGVILPHTVEATVEPVAVEQHQAAETAIASIPANTAELLKRLEAECPDLLLLIKSPPIRLAALQRTGKSSFARKLVLLRMLFLPGHKVLWATPHRELDNLVPEQLNPIGTTATGAKDFLSIEALWASIQASIDQGNQQNLSVCWDEFGSYDQFSDPESLGKSLRSLLRESSKHSYFPIIVAHGDQASFYPGVRNILTTLQQSTVKIETIGKQADSFGTMCPTGEVIVTWLDGTQKQFKVPDWLSVELLLKLLPEQPKPVENAIASPESVPQSTPVDTHKAAEKVSPSPDDAAQRITGKLADKLSAVGNEWVNVRDLIKGSFSSIEDRDMALNFILCAVKSGRLEHKEVENPNKKVSKFVRVKPKNN